MRYPNRYDSWREHLRRAMTRAMGEIEAIEASIEQKKENIVTENGFCILNDGCFFISEKKVKSFKMSYCNVKILKIR